MSTVHHCPKCGKTMEEEAKCPGLWMCPDYKVRLNDAPPFQFKCTGMELTEEGSRAIEEEIHKIIAERN